MKVLLSFFVLFSISTQAKTIEVKVNGMVCSMCAQGIQKKFKARPEVKDLRVNLEEKVVLIETKDESSLSHSVIKELIGEAGYNVGGISEKE